MMATILMARQHILLIFVVVIVSLFGAQARELTMAPLNPTTMAFLGHLGDAAPWVGDTAAADLLMERAGKAAINR
jgi:hypothetical protein